VKLDENLTAVSDDFMQIGEDFRLAGSDGLKLDELILNNPDDFGGLGTHTVKLDIAMRDLAQEFLKINDVLHLKLESVPIPGEQDAVQAVTDQLHQLLHHANDFHL
jgi:hypothetical protein